MATKPIRRARVHSSDNQVEVAYSTKRGHSELNLTGAGRRFLIQEVRASRDGSYWDIVEIVVGEAAAVARAESLALTEGRSIRVAQEVRSR